MAFEKKSLLILGKNIDIDIKYYGVNNKDFVATSKDLNFSVTSLKDSPESKIDDVIIKSFESQMQSGMKSKRFIDFDKYYSYRRYLFKKHKKISNDWPTKHNHTDMIIFESIDGSTDDQFMVGYAVQN